MAIHKDLTGDEAIHQAAYVQSADPGAVGRDKLWIDTTAGADIAAGALVKVRDAANSAWTTLLMREQEVFAQAADPGAVGAGKLWVDTTAGVTLATGAIIKQRDAADTGWNVLVMREQEVFAQAADPGAVGAGKLWVDTTTGVTVPAGAIIKQRKSDDSGWETLVIAPAPLVATASVHMGSGTTAIATGVVTDILIDFACTITAVTLVADQAGDLVVDLWADSYGNFPPLVADSICGAAKPTLSAAAKAQDVTLTGWTVAVAAGTWIRVNVDSAATVTRAVLALTLQRS